MRTSYLIDCMDEAERDLTNEIFTVLTRNDGFGFADIRAVKFFVEKIKEYVDETVERKVREIVGEDNGK